MVAITYQIGIHLDQVRDRIRLKNYSYRTEKSYISWIKRFILYHNKRHPQPSQIQFDPPVKPPDISVDDQGTS